MPPSCVQSRDHPQHEIKPYFSRIACALIGSAYDGVPLHGPLLKSSIRRRSFVSVASMPSFEQAIADGNIPGAVLVVGHDGAVVYRKAYGSRALEPQREPMTLDTVFDLASLTKVIATTTAVMQLVEQGKVRMNDPVAKYLPEFAQNGKEDITVRQLLTHYSGLAPDIDLTPALDSKESAFRLAFAETPQQAPGSGFVYSDTNFIVLGAMVEKVSGETLEAYTERHIFVPLKMTHTRFVPPAAWRAKIAPTEYDENQHMLRGGGARSEGAADGRRRGTCGAVFDGGRSGEVCAGAAEWRRWDPVGGHGGEDDTRRSSRLRRPCCAGLGGILILRSRRIAATCCRWDRSGTRGLRGHRCGSIRRRRLTSFC